MATPKAQLKQLRLIHFALMGGAGFFGLMVAFLIISGNIAQSPIEVLNYLSPAYFFIMMATHPVVFRSALRKHSIQSKKLSEKLAAYQTAHIIRMALIEGCALFASVVALLNSELLHLLALVLVLGIMFMKMPSPYLLVTELGLTQEEKNHLL